MSSPAFTDSFERLSKAHGLAFPLQFSSAASELNFLSILSLLNFASGFRVPLHKQTGRGAWDNIRALAFSLYITSSTGEEANLLSARGMQAIDMGVIAEQLRVSIHVDRPHESIPGVTVSEVGGPMYQLVQLIVRTLNETGDVLVKMGYPDLGTFVLEALKRGSNAAKDGPPDVDVVLEQVVKAIPGFQDMYIINGTRKSERFRLLSYTNTLHTQRCTASKRHSFSCLRLKLDLARLHRMRFRSHRQRHFRYTRTTSCHPCSFT